MDDHQLDEHFREAFSDFEAQPSEDTWSAIQSSIPAQTGKSVPSKRAAVLVAILVAIPLLLNELAEGNAEDNMSPADLPRQGVSDAKTAYDTNAPVGTQGETKRSEERPLSESSFTSLTTKQKVVAGNLVADESKRFTTYVPTVAKNGVAQHLGDSLLRRAIAVVRNANPVKTNISETSIMPVKKIAMYLAVMPFLGYHRFSPSSQDLTLISELESTAPLHLNRLGFQVSGGVEVGLSP